MSDKELTAIAMEWYSVILTFLCITSWICHVHVEAGTWNDTRRLLEDLMDGYDPRIRPVHDQSSQLAVRINFVVYSIKVTVL